MDLDMSVLSLYQSALALYGLIDQKTTKFTDFKESVIVFLAVFEPAKVFVRLERGEFLAVNRGDGKIKGRLHEENRGHWAVRP